MKTSEEELDETVRAKLNLLSGITAGDGEGIVVYSKGAFETQKVDKSRYRNVFSDDDICALRDHRYHSEGNYASAFDTDLIGKAGCLNSLPLLSELSGVESITQRQKVIKVKSDGKSVWALLEDGTIVTKNGSDQSSFDAIGTLRKSFSFASAMPSDITDFIDIGDSFAVSVRDLGAFLLRKEGENHATISDFGDIFSLAYDGKHFIMLRKSMTNSVALASTDGERLSEFNILGSCGQLPESLSIDDSTKGFAVLGTSWSSVNPGQIIHEWRPDSLGVGYFNCDSSLLPNKRDARYQYKVIDCDGGKARCFGVRDGNLFWLTYDENGSPSYHMTKVPMEYDDLLAAKADGTGIRVLSKLNMYVFDEAGSDDPIKAFSLQYPIEDGGFAGKTAYGSKNGSVYEYVVPNLAYSDEVSIPLNGTDGCMNIDVYVKAPKETSVSFSQGENHLDPFYSLTVNGDERVFKLRPESGSLSLSVKGLGTGLIEAVVIHMNSFYSK